MVPTIGESKSVPTHWDDLVGNNSNCIYTDNFDKHGHCLPPPNRTFFNDLPPPLSGDEGSSRTFRH
eukprot:9483276-Ditylum_brightwellii.AAC.1